MNIEYKEYLYKGKKMRIAFEYEEGSLKIKEILLLKRCKKCNEFAVKVRYEDDSIEWVHQKKNKI